MLRLAWKGFVPWLEEHHARDVHYLEETLKNIASFHDSVSQGALQELLEDKSCTRILKLSEVYLESLRDGGNLSAFSMSCLDMAEIVLGLIRASK